VDIKQSQEALMFEPERKLSRPYVSSELSKTKRTEERNIIGFVRMGFSFDGLDADINEIIKIGLSVTGMFLVLGILVTYYIAQVLTRPITTLTEGVKAIIQGNLKQQIHIHSQDEFAGLADAFNEMTKRLRTRMEEIRQKNEELESFAHTVSHDLKAPLISIQGFSSMLQKKHENGLGKKGKFYLERIQKNVEHMDRLIHDLLRLSRIGRTKVVMGPVEMESVIKEVIGELMLLIKERNINIEITDDLPVVYGNKTQVYQIVSNLISNAVKFIGDTPQPKIEITSEKIDNYYKIGVKDNGIGIEEKHYDRIFGMFQRLDNKTEGTGVGLAIVKRLVEMEGGEVVLESEPGKGAAFYVTLPGERYQKI
jgi:signal transduction histidine kinase